MLRDAYIKICVFNLETKTIEIELRIVSSSRRTWEEFVKVISLVQRYSNVSVENQIITIAVVAERFTREDRFSFTQSFC